MSGCLLFAVLLAVAFDFAMPDAVLLVSHARVLQSDDEEESVPSRRQRVGENEQRVVVFKSALGAIEKTDTRPATERRVGADRFSSQEVWRVAPRRAPTFVRPRHVLARRPLALVPPRA